MEAAPPLEADFLSDGGQPAEAVATRLAAFLDGARSSLEIAIYDLAPGDPSDAVLRRALLDARARGVATRLVFNREHHPRRRPLPPPGFVDWDYLHSLELGFRPIDGVPDLMHHKYVVRDAASPGASVWTGSANWTADSWSREENVIVRLHNPGVAACYREDFEQLWETRSVRLSGRVTAAWTEPAAGLRVRAHFTPGRAAKLVHEIAQRIATAQRRIRICSPVLTSGPVLASLAEALRNPDVDFAGCYDRTQMDEVEYQWGRAAHATWKLQAWATVRDAVPWGAKRSTPYQPGSVHDFMHAKCSVADDTVFVGSYNLSHSGEANAEDVLEIENRAVADAFAAYVERVSARYRQAPGG